MMRKLLSILVTLFLVCCVGLASLQAQVTTASTTGPNFSLTNSTLPTVVLPVFTVTGTGNATTNLGGFGMAVVNISGTYSSINLNLQLSNGGAAGYSNATLIPVTGGQPLQTLSGANTAVNGQYFMAIAGMTSLKVLSNATFTGTSAIIRITATAIMRPDIPLFLAADPCMDKNMTKQSVAISGTAPNAIKAIPLATAKNIYVCEISVITGTAATSVQVKAGTQTTNPCDTGAVNLTGAMGITVGQQLFGGWGGTVFGPPQIPVANDVCVFVAGGTAAYAGWATWVQI